MRNNKLYQIKAKVNDFASFKKLKTEKKKKKNVVYLNTTVVNRKIYD